MTATSIVNAECPACGSRISEPLFTAPMAYPVTRPHHQVGGSPCRVGLVVYPDGSYDAYDLDREPCDMTMERFGREAMERLVGGSTRAA